RFDVADAARLRRDHLDQQQSAPSDVLLVGVGVQRLGAVRVVVLDGDAQPAAAQAYFDADLRGEQRRVLYRVGGQLGEDQQRVLEDLLRHGALAPDEIAYGVPQL